MSVLTIAGRELRATFSTMIGWFVAAGVLAVAGFLWIIYLDNYAQISADTGSDPYRGFDLTYADYLLGPWFAAMALLLMLVCPAVSMRLFSEEYQQATMELLLTSPISTLDIVLGKYLGAVGFVAVLLLATSYAPLGLMALGDPDPALIACGYGALLLLSAAVLAMGALFSAMTSNQIAALVPTFCGSLLLWVLSYASYDSDSWTSQLATLTHVQALFTGAVRLSDIVYFAVFIGVFLLATHQRVESNRWR
jgi:ABC-2 type transport system permease protein